MVARQKNDVLKRWTVADSLETYAIRNWGEGYFSIGDNGQMLCHPTREPAAGIDMKALVDELGRRGIPLPILLLVYFFKGG